MGMIRAVLFGWDEAKRQIRIVDREIAHGPKTIRKRLLNRLAAAGRDAARRNITTQGGGRWDKLSPWTMAQTGRKKALITLRKFITVKKANAAGTRSATIFRSPGDYSLTQHHRGFTEAATGTVVKIALKRPTALGSKFKGKKVVAFKDNRDKEVPARPVWPEGKQLHKIITRNIRLWRADMRRALARRR